jgi:hypothetical protein
MALPESVHLLDTATEVVREEDPTLARRLGAQAAWMREWGYRTHEYDRMTNVARRVLGMVEVE